MQTISLIATVAVVASAGFLAIGQSAEHNLSGTSQADAVSSQTPQVGGRAEGASWAVRLAKVGQWLGDTVETMGRNSVGLGIHGDALMAQFDAQSAARAATRAGAGADITPPKAVAGAPEALVANWRGPTGNMSADMRYFDQNNFSWPKSSIDADGVVTFEYGFKLDKLQQAFGGRSDKAALQRLRRDARTRGAQFEVSRDKAVVRFQEHVGLSDRFAAQARLRALASGSSYSAETGMETLSISVPWRRSRELSSLLTRAGSDLQTLKKTAPVTDVVSVEVRFATEVPRSAADRMLSQLIVEHGAEVGVNRNGHLYAQLPRAGVLGESVRGLTRSDSSIKTGFAKASEAPELYPELANKPIDATRQWVLDNGLDLASPRKPYRFTFEGVDAFDL